MTNDNLDYLDTNCAGMDTREALIPHNTRVAVIIKDEEFIPFKSLADGGTGSIGAQFVVTCQTDEIVDGNIRDAVTGIPKVVDRGTFLRHKILCVVKDKSGREHWDAEKLAKGTTYTTEYKNALASYDEVFVGVGNARDIKTTKALRVGERVMAKVVIEEYNGKQYNAISEFVVA